MNSIEPRRTKEQEELSAFLLGIGNRVRELRRASAITRKKLSQLSGVSERYLAQLETGTGNVSVSFLYRIAKSLGVSPQDLMPMLSSHPVDKIGIALIGLRGAGKTTLGRRLAKSLSRDFVELNQVIEEHSGMPVGEVIALYGQEGYRQLESKVLESLVAQEQEIVLAVGGGIVSEPKTYDVLRQHYFTVWLKAEPEDHMARVRAQGDNRPMSGNPEAMADLRKILTGRESLYGLADVTVDTHQKSIEETLARLVALTS